MKKTFRVTLVAQRDIEMDVPEGELPEKIAADLQRNARSMPAGFLQGEDLIDAPSISVSVGVLQE